MSDLNKLVEFNFDTNETFDVNGNYNIVRDLRIERENLKSLESENQIKTLGPKYIDEQTITEFNNKKDNLRNLMRRFGADKEELINMSNETGGERDKLYEISNFLYNKFIEFINNINYNIVFSYDEFDFIVKTINNKLEYNVDEVFQLSKLKIDFLDSVIEDFKKVGKNDNLNVSMKISDIILLYHLLSKYKVHGYNRQFEIFISVLNKIGEANQVFNALNIIKERINTEFQQWATSITPDEEQVKPSGEPEPNK